MPDEEAKGRRARGWAVGHVGQGTRSFTVFAAGTADRGWVGAGPAGDRLAHGVNRAGLVVAIDGDPELPGLEGVVQQMLEQAENAAGARALLSDGWRGASFASSTPVVTVVSARDGWTVALGGAAGPPHPLGAERPGSGVAFRRKAGRGPRPLLDMERQLRSATSDAGTPARSMLVASWDAAGAPTVRLGLGSPISAVLLRVWPGHQVGPPAGALGPGPSRLGRLAEEVDTRVATGTLAPAAVRGALGAVASAVLAEGDDAEHQALLLAAQGDESGAAVRRLVAQTYAGSLLEAALSGLLEKESR